MRKVSWLVRFGAVLIVLSASFYLLHFLIFQNPGRILDYLLSQIAFVPISVMLVTFVIDGLLTRRERQEKIKKLNMVIGAFFSEVGTPLVKELADFCTGDEELETQCATIGEWAEQEFTRVRKSITDEQIQVSCQQGDLIPLKEFLIQKRDFLLRLLENPNLLEHESFTDLLWAVFHLTEELVNRKDTEVLPGSDLDHLSGDIQRVYIRLIGEWLLYMDHLRTDYPYLFSLAVRTNPFNPKASPIVP